MIAIDFFCGAGGLTRGLLDANIDVVAGLDIDEQCQDTYNHNNYGTQFIHSDIKKLNPYQFRTSLRDINPDELLLAGCAPCQPFSQLNRGERSDDATLLGRFLLFVEILQPRQIFIENVIGITKVRGASTYKRFRKQLSYLGYNYAEGIIDAKDYGVPQTRKRFIMIAIRGFPVSLPSTTHGANGDPYKTVFQAIHNYPAIQAGESHPTIPNHFASALSELNLRRIMNTPPDGGDRRDWPEELWLECHKNGHEGHTDVYGRMKWNSPSPALTCRCHSLSNGRYGHPEQNRAISLREAAKLQGFRDDYIFFGYNKHIAKQIGNAVPVQLAEAVGNHIQSIVQ